MRFNMPPNIIGEDDIEQALLQRLQHLHGFDTLNCYTARSSSSSSQASANAP